MKKFITLMTSIATLGLVAMVVMPTYAEKSANTPNNGNSHNKANGQVGYTAVNLQRYAEFDVHERDAKEMYFDLVGDWIINFDFGSPYVHDMTVVSQNDSSFEATGGYPSPGPYTHEWEAVGSVDGYDIEITITYLTGNVGYEVYMDGIIDHDGSMSGTCTTSSNQVCKWSTTSGKVNLNGQKGVHHYSDVNGDWYDVDVSMVKVEGKYAYYAGEVVLSSNPGWIGNWMNAAVYDNGTPGSEGDEIWGIFTNEPTSLNNVENGNPPGSSYAITSGNLVVHYSDPEEVAPYGPVSLEEGETYRVSDNAIDNKWDLSGEFVAHSGYDWADLAEGATWNYDFHIKESLDDESSVGSLHFSTGDINVVGHVKDFKNNYSYWSGDENIAAVGTAMYDNSEYYFMFMYSERAVWFTLSDQTYHTCWTNDTVYARGVCSSIPRLYELHSKVPDETFLLDFKDIH